jgi:hypothetical protein
MKKSNTLYKIIGFLIGVILAILTGCSHIHKDKVVKMNDGKYYILEASTAYEAYHLIEVDTAAVNFIKK